MITETLDIAPLSVVWLPSCVLWFPVRKVGPLRSHSKRPQQHALRWLINIIGPRSDPPYSRTWSADRDTPDPRNGSGRRLPRRWRKRKIGYVCVAVRACPTSTRLLCPCPICRLSNWQPVRLRYRPVLICLGECWLLCYTLGITKC